MTGVSKTAVTKFVVNAGTAAARYHERFFRNLQSKRIQVEEVWGFVGSKAKTYVPSGQRCRKGRRAWLWVSTDAETKLVPTWLVGTREGEFAAMYMHDLADRLSNRVQLTTDGH